MAQESIETQALIEARLQTLHQEIQQADTNCDLTKGRIDSAQEQLREFESIRRSVRGALVELSQLHGNLFGPPEQATVKPVEISVKSDGEAGAEE